MAISNVLISYFKTARTAKGVDQAQYPAITNTAAPDSLTTQSFTAATFAAVSIPTGATGVVIIPPAGNAGNITIKGITGDTGILLGVLTKPYYQPLTASSSLGILCAADTVLEFNWM